MSSGVPSTAVFAFRGAHSGWLYKEKGDYAVAKWFQPVGLRYFTIDFDTHILAYYHSETSKQGGQLIPFKEILGAYSLTDELLPSRDQGWGLLTNSRRSSASGSGAWAFELQIARKRIRLSSDLETDALRWVSMLNAAHRQGIDPSYRSAPVQRCAGRLSTPTPMRSFRQGEDSSCASSGRSDKASQQSTSPGASTPNSGGTSTPKSLSDTSEIPSVTVWNDVIARVEELERHQSLSGTLITAALCFDSAKPHSHSSPRDQLPKDDHFDASNCSPSSKRFQAADFGFEDDEDAGTSTGAEEEPSAPSTPRVAVTVSLAEPFSEENDSSDEEAVGNAQQASRMMADLLLLQKKLAVGSEAARVLADLALAQKRMPPRLGKKPRKSCVQHPAAHAPGFAGLC